MPTCLARSARWEGAADLTGGGSDRRSGHPRSGGVGLCSPSRAHRPASVPHSPHQEPGHPPARPVPLPTSPTQQFPSGLWPLAEPLTRPRLMSSLRRSSRRVSSTSQDNNQSAQQSNSSASPSLTSASAPAKTSGRTRSDSTSSTRSSARVAAKRNHEQIDQPSSQSTVGSSQQPQPTTKATPAR